jgi:hypothetical protein
LDETCVPRSLLEERFAFLSWKEANEIGTRVYFSNFFFAHYIASSLKLAARQESQPKALTRSIHSLWQSASHGGAEPFRIDLYQVDSRRDAREKVMKLLASLSSPTLGKRDIAGLGDVTFLDDEFENIVFAAGNLVFYLRSLCTKVGPLIDRITACEAKPLHRIRWEERIDHTGWWINNSFRVSECPRR